MRNSLLYLVAGAILAAVIAVAKNGFKGKLLLQKSAAAWETYLSEAEQAALSWVSREHAGLKAIAAGRPLSEAVGMEAIREVASQPYAILIHRQDSLLFSSNSAVGVREEQLRALLPKGEQRTFVQGAAASFFVYARPFTPETVLSVWVPVEQWTAGQRLLPQRVAMPAEVCVVAPDGGEAVRVGGTALFALAAPGDVQPIWVQQVLLAAALLWVLLLLMWVSRQALRWHQKGRPWAAAGLLGATWLSLTVLNTAGGLSRPALNALPVFAHRFEQPIWGVSSVGDFLLHAGLLLWFAVFLHRVGRMENVGISLSKATRRGLSALGYAAVVGIAIGLIDLCRRLVYHSGIAFDFDNLLRNTEGFAGGALAGLLVIQLALFLLQHRLVFLSHRLCSEGRERAIAWTVGAGVVLALVGVARILPYSTLGLAIAFSAAYTVLVAISFAQRLHRLVLLAVCLMLFSAVATWALYSTQEQRDQQTQQRYAEALAVGRDSLQAEQQLREIARRLEEDTVVGSRLLKAWPFRPLAATLRQRAYEHVYPYSYLFQNYRLSVFAFDESGAVLPRDQIEARASIVDAYWERGIPVASDFPQVRFCISDKGIARYMVRTVHRRMNDPAQPVELYYFFDHVFPNPQQVYVELFYKEPYKGMVRLSDYDYAVQRYGYLVVERGTVSHAVFSQNLPRGYAKERMVEQPQRRVYTVYSTPDGTAAAAIGRTIGGFRKPLFFFSVWFVSSLLIATAIALLNSFPSHYSPRFSSQGSLSVRIHYRTFALIGIGFAGAIALTYFHFDAQARQQRQTTQDRKVETLMTYLRIQLSDASPQSDSLSQIVPQILAPQAAGLSLDVNCFFSDGRLLFSTQSPLVWMGVLPDRMSLQAWAYLIRTSELESAVQEYAGGIPYLHRYLALRNDKNQLLGFVGIPYNTSKPQIGPEASDFIGLLASVYVFLLFIAYAASYTLSNSIISPLKLISNKIQRLQLEGKNEPLEYAAPAGDEISSLIEEYNRMVEKLEASKAQLIRLERESAWREMARQVAHDIKNPLTTIKLSMQQLERLSSNPEQAAAYLKKAIARLIEQIDSLAQIATEFSLFANTDLRNKHDIVLNDLVESVYDLFTENREVEMNLELPQERLHIQGDKNHLIRVLNNLVINATQAIPPGRKGRIVLSLAAKNGYSIIRVRDNGGGIPPEIQLRVFEPNFTTKSSGSGLGLAICKRIIEAHEGRIDFTTWPGEGTEFWIELPLSLCEEVSKAGSSP